MQLPSSRVRRHRAGGQATRKRAGFTLIEIAIVLVIIGLILGGILQGQELITSARVRSLADQTNNITVAWFAFQDRYRGVPGDYVNASTQIQAGLQNGDGNGNIDTDQERGQIWAHLGAAGILAGQYDGAPTAATYNCPAATCPQNAFNRGFLITRDNQALNNPVATNELWSGNQIPALILAEMDRKIDDGQANSGRMQLGQGGAGWAAANSALCLDGAGTGYAVLADPGDCAVVFRNF